MILFFGDVSKKVYALETTHALNSEDILKLVWLFGESPQIEDAQIIHNFVGPRATMITPWSTNAVEITQNMAIKGIKRIEQYYPLTDDLIVDPMLSQKYDNLDQSLFDINIQAEAILEIDDIRAYNTQEGLALSDDEVSYLEQLAESLGRKLTDSEVFGFSQVNSEHCRHKIFNGTFIIDGKEQEESLFAMIKKTSKENPNEIVSAYKDNVAFINGPEVIQFAPASADKPDYYEKKSFKSVISLKAETHNFPTTVEPFNGAATGAGGEIRDRLAGGKGSLPLAGTAVYMTAYSRLADNRSWENNMPERKWLYQTPIDILIKASIGASDFGNKFGQPLINGSLLTFEHEEEQRRIAYDKVIMLAGGIGYGKANQAIKSVPQTDDEIVIMGGDNYRIGMGGAAVSSADTGAFSSGIELNAVQRSNPEMQKRVANAIRGLVEADSNPIVSIHDHGAGGHLNCLSELVEDTGGKINLDALPVGDPTLSAKELVGNESQERMGLVIGSEHLETLKKIAERERSPLYTVGKVTGDHHFSFESESSGAKPMDLKLEDMFGSSPKTIMNDVRLDRKYQAVEFSVEDIQEDIRNVLRLEAVACKDWLTNKVDRCVGGRVAKQQCCGPLQLPLNNCGVMALDYDTTHGIATAMGHDSIGGLIDPVSGAINSIAESLTNIIWAPLEKGIRSVSLSANWMWPCNNEGEDARLYDAVRAISDYSIGLGINVPTGKDSLSMKQKYPDGDVISPGTVIITAVGHCDDINKVVEPVFKRNGGDIYYIDLSKGAYELGGSSFAQTKKRVGAAVPVAADALTFANVFDAIQDLISDNKITAGHDISAGGILTTLLELCFSDNNLGAEVDLSTLEEKETTKLLFAENAGIVIQAENDVEEVLNARGIIFHKIGKVTSNSSLEILNGKDQLSFDISALRDVWYETSFLLDKRQCANEKANDRFANYKNQALQFKFPKSHSGELPSRNLDGPRPKAAIIREKGSNSEREMAHAMYLAGFDVRDVHMTDLISGRETLEDIKFIGAVGGFSNSDVLGSAKGWAGAFKYNDKARTALDNFFKRDDVLSVGICNGCQLFVELDLINPEHDQKSKMLHNDSQKHESGFTSVQVQENNSVMLSSLAGSTLGVWISHGEGKFHLPMEEENYNIVAKYGYDAYPANPNGSDYNTAMMASKDGRHLVMMPHIERSMFRWNWAHYDDGRDDTISPWIDAFVNARNWILKNS